MTFRFTRERPFHQHQIGRSGFELYYNFNPITKKAIQRTSRCLIDKQFFISFKDVAENSMHLILYIAHYVLFCRKLFKGPSVLSLLYYLYTSVPSRFLSYSKANIERHGFFWNRIDKEKILQSFFFQGFLSRTLKIHRPAWKGRGLFFVFSTTST